MTQPHAYELVRSLLIFMHLAAMIAAGISIAFGDYAILRHRPVNRDLMVKASRAVTWSLVALWITGLSVISLDMSTVSLTLAKAPKLQAKLTVVLILTANGFLLHRYTLTALGGRKRPTEQQVKLSAILGAVSATSWGYAMFLGIAKAWTPILGVTGFLMLYALGLAFGTAVSLRWVRPMLMPAMHPERPETGHATRKPSRTAAREGLIDDDLTPLAG
jgi:dipeptide/tripeptide permease